MRKGLEENIPPGYDHFRVIKQKSCTRGSKRLSLFFWGNNLFVDMLFKMLHDSNSLKIEQDVNTDHKFRCHCCDFRNSDKKLQSTVQTKTELQLMWTYIHIKHTHVKHCSQVISHVSWQRCQTLSEMPRSVCECIMYCTWGLISFDSPLCML